MIRLAVRVRRAEAEQVLAELLELAPEGVEEVEIGEDTVEYAVYGAPGELPSLPDLTGAAGGSLVDITTSETPDDWHERWRSFHRPVLVEASPPAGGRTAADTPALHVRAPWQPASAREGVIEIEIDPGQAFGTGAHATTRLCLGLMLDLAGGERTAGRLLDLGTGSGVLAIAGALLGFSPVLALDHDPLSVEAARANGEVNQARIDVRRLDVRRERLPWLDAGDAPGARPVVVANLLAPLLRELAQAMTAAPAHLIVSGLLSEEAGELAELFCERLSLCERERRDDEGWAAVWLSPSAA